MWKLLTKKSTPSEAVYSAVFLTLAVWVVRHFFYSPGLTLGAELAMAYWWIKAIVLLVKRGKQQ